MIDNFTPESLCIFRCIHTHIYYFSPFSSRDEQTIARAMTTLRDSGRVKIQRGVYTIPFQFVLPTSLPSSSQFPREGGRSFNGRIEFFLRAQLGDYTVEKSFLVESAPLPSDVVPCMVRPTTYELKRLGVLNKGCLSVGASVENSRIGKGQTLKVNVASRNDTSLDIVRVRLKLVELIQYRAQEVEDSIKTDLEKLKDLDLPGVVKEKSSGNNMKRNQKGFEQKVESVYKEIYTDLVSGSSQIELVVPKRSRDSYDGHLMIISHHVEVKFFTKSMIENPQIKIPIVIGNSKDAELRIRVPNTPIATELVDEDIPEAPDSPCDDESTITVGTNAADIPMANAVFFETESLLDNVSGNKKFGQSKYKTKSPSPTRIAPRPSAPSESLLQHHEPARKFKTNVRNFDGRSIPDSPESTSQSSSSEDNNYSPYRMYASQTTRPMRVDYSYEDSDVSTFQDSVVDKKSPAARSSKNLQQYSNFTQRQSNRRDPESMHRLIHLIHELRGSIHDYEVIVTYARQPEYRTLYSSLSPQELGIILFHVSMNHQVKVARLLARQMAFAQAFLCEHCAEAVRTTSEFFRSNMVEALLPFCEDLTTNRRLIHAELSEWEQLITHRLFHGLYEC